MAGGKGRAAILSGRIIKVKTKKRKEKRTAEEVTSVERSSLPSRENDGS